MQDQHVQLIDAQLSGRLVESAQRGVVAEVGDPDFRFDEYLVTVQPGAADRFAHLALVTVGRRGVDVAVTDLQRGLDGCNGLRGRGLEDTETEYRDGHTVVQRVGGDAHTVRR